MQIVIDIPEDVYTRLFDNGIQDNEIAVDDVCEMARALRLGKPVTKGHGDLIDRDKVLDDIEKKYPVSVSETDKCKKYARLVYYWAVKNSPTIIEEDKERKE